MTILRAPLPLSVALALAVASALLVAAPAAATETTETTTIRPVQLERGDGPRVPMVLGGTILDGDLAVRVDADEVYLVGRSGADYVVETYDDGAALVERVTPEGERTTLVDGFRGAMLLSDDGGLLYEAIVRTAEETRLVVRDAATGDRVARRSFAGVVTVLDADADGAVLGVSGPDQTLRWDPRTDDTRRISRRTAYFADLGADRLAVFRGDPYDGGCSVLSTLARPRSTLWRSCRRAVIGASPDGRRLVSWPILMDGPLVQVSVHRGHGRVVDRYRSAGTFGPVRWETRRSLLMVTHGRRKSAVVRCRADECERASRLVASP